MGEVNPMNRDRDGWCRVEVSPDFMEAYLTIEPPLGNGKWPTRKEVDEALQGEGVVYGAIDLMIDQAVNNHITKPMVIARGKQPQHGNDAELIFHFETGIFRKASLEDERGKIDFHDVQTVQYVNAGQVIAAKKPATKGELGRDVRGKDLPAASGKDKYILSGKNVAWTEDGLKLVATRKGEPIYANNKVSVHDVHEVNGDVDFNTGNINFPGNVVIRGNITNGFKVEAEGDVTIYGSVEASEINSGGNVYIQGGVSGLDKTVIRCTGDFSAKYIEHCIVNSYGSLTVREAIMYCQVNADQKVIVEGGRGLIVGGLIRAGIEISARVIGSRLGTVTEIEVGVVPRLKLEYQNLDTEVKQTKENIEKSEKAIALLSKIPNLPPERQDTLQSLIKTVYALKAKATDTETRRQGILEDMVIKSKLGRVKVMDTIYPGTRVTIGKSMYIVPDELKYIILYYNEGEVQLQSYR